MRYMAIVRSVPFGDTAEKKRFNLNNIPCNILYKMSYKDCLFISNKNMSIVLKSAHNHPSVFGPFKVFDNQNDYYS